MGPGLCSLQPPPIKGFTSHLNVQPTPAVEKALRPWPLPLAAVLSLSPCGFSNLTKIGSLWDWRGRVTVSHWGQMQKPQGSVMEGVFFSL